MYRYRPKCMISPNMNGSNSLPLYYPKDSAMLMHPNSQDYPLPFRNLFQSSSHHYAHESEMPHAMSRLKSMHVEIRNRELRDYKRKMRDEVLRSQQMDEMLELVPADSDSANLWAQELAQAYAHSFKFELPMHKVVDIFKLAEKFPRKHTLELLEVILAKASKTAVDMMFQYDVMRLLHGFINFSGKNAPNRTDLNREEAEIMKEVVISTSTMDIMESTTTTTPTYLEQLQLARISLRAISHLCRKEEYVRNFAVLNHKTATYCLKAMKHFGEDIKLEFHMFLEAATSIPFSRRGEEQFTRLTAMVGDRFFAERMTVKIELFNDHNERSELKAYEYIIRAMINLLEMKISDIEVKLLYDRHGNMMPILDKMVELIGQTNYVLNYPSARDNKEEDLPVDIMEAAFLLAMEFVEKIGKYTEIVVDQTGLISEAIRFLQFKHLATSCSAVIISRRAAYFLLANHFYDLQDQSLEKIASVIFFGNNQEDNVVSLLAYYLEHETNSFNVSEVVVALRSLFECIPARIIEPLLLPSELVTLMMERLLDTPSNFEGSMITEESANHGVIFVALITFLEKVGPAIGSRLEIYISLILSYSDKLHAVYDRPNIGIAFRHYYNLLLHLCQCSPPGQDAV